MPSFVEVLDIAGIAIAATSIVVMVYFNIKSNKKPSSRNISDTEK